MACNGVVSLVKELDELIVILHKILNIKIMQAKLFIEKVGEVIRVLEMEGPSTLSDQLAEDTALLALPIGDCVRRTGVLTSLSIDIMSIRPVWGRKLLGDVPELVKQIGLNANKLEKFLNESDFYNSWEDLRHNLALLPSRQAARDLLHSCRELKDTMNFFHEVATESYFLFQHLKFLQEFAELCERSNEWRCRQFVKGIMDVANRALDALECADKYSLRSEIREFEVREIYKLGWRYGILKYARENCIEKKAKEFFDGKNCKRYGILKYVMENCIEKKAKEFFDGKNGKRLVLLETLGMLHSFTEEIDMTRGKLGREDPQLQNASSGAGRNGFPSLSMIREKFAGKDLPSLPITYYLRAFPVIERRKRRKANSFLQNATA